jgi:hypothetical protein
MILFVTSTHMQEEYGSTDRWTVKALSAKQLGVLRANCLLKRRDGLAHGPAQKQGADAFKATRHLFLLLNT